MTVASAALAHAPPALADGQLSRLAVALESEAGDLYLDACAFAAEGKVEMAGVLLRQHVDRRDRARALRSLTD